MDDGASCSGGSRPLSLASFRGPAYGYEMTKRLRARGLSMLVKGRSIHFSAGWSVTPSWKRGVRQQRGPPRKYYSLSPEGERALEVGVREWETARDAVDGALGLVKVEVQPCTSS